MKLEQWIYRLALKAEVVLKGHILNPLWQSRRRRHERRQPAFAQFRRYFDRYYLDPVRSLTDPGMLAGSDEPEKIYTIWLQGRDAMPPIVNACVSSIEKRCSLPLVLLEEKDIHNYIDLPGAVIDKYRSGMIRPAHFSDICRVELLSGHGGVWMDASLYAVDDIPKWIMDRDFFVYMVGGVGDSYSYMQNCFIRARKGHFLLEAWRAMMLDYWTKEKSALDYFQHQLMFESIVLNDPRAASLFASMPKVDQDPTHNLWFNHRDDVYTPEAFAEIVRGSFYQKTASGYRDIPAPGTTVDWILNHS